VGGGGWGGVEKGINGSSGTEWRLFQNNGRLAFWVKVDGA